MKNRVKVTVCGAEYTLASEKSQEEVGKIAAAVDKQMTDLLDSNDRISVLTAAVVTALDFCDKAMSDSTSADNLRGQIQEYLTDIATFREEVEKLKEENSVLKNQIQQYKNLNI